MPTVPKSPGRTRLVNFFYLNGQVTLVDLPGYGFSRVNHQQRAEFLSLTRSYLTTRKQLRLILHLVDASVYSELDYDYMQCLRALSRGYLLVVNKSDKLARMNQLKSQQFYQEKFALSPDKVILTSAKSHLNIHLLRSHFKDL